MKKQLTYRDKAKRQRIRSIIVEILTAVGLVVFGYIMAVIILGY